MNPLNYVFLALLFYFGYGIWYDYFATKNKMTDDQLINRYLFLAKKGKLK